MTFKEAIQAIWEFRSHWVYGTGERKMTQQEFELAIRDWEDKMHPNRPLEKGQIAITIPDVQTTDEAETLLFALLDTFLDTALRFPDAKLEMHQARKVRDVVQALDYPDAWFHSVSGNGLSVQYASVSETDCLTGDALPPALARCSEMRIVRKVAPLYQGPWKELTDDQ
jgi:hypothetical protein